MRTESNPMTCEQCNTEGGFLRRAWDAKGGLLWLCGACWVPREPKAAAVRVVDATANIPCDFYPDRPQAPARAFGGTIRAESGAGGESSARADIAPQNGADESRL